MAAFPTPFQDIALNLAFRVMGECRFNRTYQEYMDIAARLPPLKVLVHKINEQLQELHNDDGIRLPEICRFKARDERYTYEKYPREISYETVRGRPGYFRNAETARSDELNV